MDIWKNRLVRKGCLSTPVVEMTPFVFKNRLYRLDAWRGNFGVSGIRDGREHCFSDQAEIRDMERDTVVSITLKGYATPSCFVWHDKLYVFATKHHDDDIRWENKEIFMTASDDLKNWTDPVKLFDAKENGEHYFNVNICRGKNDFVMLVESDDQRWLPKFTFKYFRSDNLIDWKPVPDGIYGIGKYVGGPGLYYEEPYYYTTYLHELPEGWETRITRPKNLKPVSTDGVTVIDGWETRITRSKDLVCWQDAPDGRAVVSPDSNIVVHVEGFPAVRETNASDVELCYWNGKTIVYFTGGDQYSASQMQWAEFDGTIREFLEHYFAE